MPFLRAALLACAALAAAGAAEEAAATCDGAGDAECGRQLARPEDAGDGGDDTSMLSVRALEGRKEAIGLQGQKARDAQEDEQEEEGQLEGGCIKEPKDYAKEFAKAPHMSRDPRCVCSELWGHIYSCKDNKTLHGNSELAWIFGKGDLEKILEYQKKYGKEDKGAKVASAVFVMVGFGPPSLDDDLNGLCLGVFKLPPRVVAPVMGMLPEIPVWTYWFSRLSQSKFQIPYEVQHYITIEYSRTSHEMDVLDVFQTITGCKKDSIQVDGNDGCKNSALKVDDKLKNVRQQGIKCVEAFFDGAGKKGWTLDDPAAVRMMLWSCYDVNPYNTGVGLGWNSYPNPLVCTAPDKQNNTEHYMGDEYVIQNVEIAHLPKFTPIELPNVSKAQNNQYTTSGFC